MDTVTPSVTRGCLGPIHAKARAGLLRISELTVVCRPISLYGQCFYSSTHRRDEYFNASSIPDKWHVAKCLESSTSMDLTMKSSYASALVLTLAALAGGHAVAGQNSADHGPSSAMNSMNSFVSTKTRADVLAELAEAQRTGDIVVRTENHGPSLKLNELYPEQYPAKPAIQGKTRSEVLAELAEAQRNGEIVAVMVVNHS